MFAHRRIQWIVAAGCCLALLVGCGTAPKEDSGAYGEGENIAIEDTLQQPDTEISLEVSVSQPEASVVPAPSSLGSSWHSVSDSRLWRAGFAGRGYAVHSDGVSLI